MRTREIETINRCNGTCPFCPVNANQPQRKYAKMTDELFKKIIDDLAGMNYSERISLFSNNEPFLDERILDFHKYANEKLPNAFFCLYTNGSLLTFDKFIEIVKYLDEMIIDNYNDDRKPNSPELQKIYDYLQQNPKMRRKVRFVFRLQHEILSSRGGQAPNKNGMNDTRARKILCPLPYTQMIVRPTGEVSLCCNDALGKITMGDLNSQSILEVWTSEKYQEFRREMLANARKNLPLCRDCDSTYGSFMLNRRNR